VSIDARSEKVGFKIREAQLRKVPFMLVVGDKEAESKTVAVRNRKKGDLGPSSLEDLASALERAVARDARGVNKCRHALRTVVAMAFVRSPRA
jgi:threonyl-tRNA synthetase